MKFAVCVQAEHATPMADVLWVAIMKAEEEGVKSAADSVLS